MPVSERVETSAAEALNRSKCFARTPLNFPEMPPVPRFFSNALVVGTEKPSLRGTNAGLIIATHEIDTESLDEFEPVLAWTRGTEGDFNKSPFAELDRRLCGCHEYRGYSIVYSGRRSLHFHFFFQTKHLINAAWDAIALQRRGGTRDRRLDAKCPQYLLGPRAHRDRRNLRSAQARGPTDAISHKMAKNAVGDSRNRRGQGLFVPRFEGGGQNSATGYP